MSWRETFAARFGPGLFLGMTFGDWWRTLRENGFAVDRPYWGRAAVTTFCSLQNSVLRWYEDARYVQRILQAHVEPPLFILGVWRSGTTHLHKLFALDDRFAYPNFYQALYPHSFLCPRS
jgi:omega-hydroxy-beta-dihydromenaquinone-9 sulfotransferase